MAHDVKFTIPERTLGKADVEFKVKKDKAALGTLKVSSGTVVWTPRDHTYGFRMAWADFDTLMKKKGVSEKD